MHSSVQITKHIGRSDPHCDHFKPCTGFSSFSLSFFFFPTFVVLCLVAKSCLIFCDHMDCIMPGFPVFHYLLEFIQSHVYWIHDSIKPSSVTLFLSRPQSFPASGSFQMSRLFESGGQSIGAPASIIPVNIQSWFPLGLTALISLQSKGLSRVFSSTTVWKHQFFSAQPSSHLGPWNPFPKWFTFTQAVVSGTAKLMISVIL